MSRKKDIPNTPEERAHAAKRDALMKERPQEWDHIQRERQKIREEKTTIKNDERHVVRIMQRDLKQLEMKLLAKAVN